MDKQQAEQHIKTIMESTMAITNGLAAKIEASLGAASLEEKKKYIDEMNRLGLPKLLADIEKKKKEINNRYK